MRDRFEVIGVHAVPHTAEMVELEMRGDFPDPVLVCGTMCANGACVLVFETGVAFGCEGVLPQPAEGVGDFDFAQESHDRSLVHWCSADTGTK